MDPPLCCFVCADEAPVLHRVCACNQLVHDACLQQLIARVPTYANGCAVCGRRYDIVATPTCRVQCVGRMGSVSGLLLSLEVLFCGFLTVAVTCTVFILLDDGEDTAPVPYVFPPVAGVVAFGGALLAVHTLYVREVRRLCCLRWVWRRRVVLPATLVPPPPPEYPVERV